VRIRAAGPARMEVLLWWIDDSAQEAGPKLTRAFHDQVGLHRAGAHQGSTATAVGGAAFDSGQVSGAPIKSSALARRWRPCRPSTRSACASRILGIGDVLHPGGRKQQGRWNWRMWRRCAESCRKATFDSRFRSSRCG